ncbi:MAG: low affinity iron permease family protein [Stellaceae bacterium]
MPSLTEMFSSAASATSRWTGRASAFLLCCLIVVVWAVTGPVFHYSDTWQLVINTGTTIVTFLMVFLIQNTQTRDTAALHLKLDELIRVSTRARNSLLGLEDMSDQEIEQARTVFQRLTVVKTPAAPAKPGRTRRARPKLVSSKEEVAVTTRAR